MSKRILYSLLGLALIFFIGSLIIFLNSKKDSEELTPDQKQIQESAQEGKEKQLLEVKFFFLTNRSRFMRPVKTELEIPSSRQDLYKLFIETLLKGEKNYIVPVPDGVNLRTLYYIDIRETLVLDFNEKLISSFPSGSTRELEFIYFIVDNICYNFKEIKKVKFIISGNEYKFLTGHIDMENPFFPDYRYIRDE
jgi:hypothetical protein